MVKGDGIKDYAKNPKNRAQHIFECTKISGLDDITYHHNPATEEHALIIKVPTLNSFNILKNQLKWPRNAFKSGVTVEALSLKIEVKILGFELDRVINPNSLLLEKLKRNGLTNVTRVKVNEKAKNQLTASVISPAYLCELIKFGLRISPRRYQVVPVIKYTRPCKKCQSLYHSPKGCRSSLRCSRCGETWT